jgi:hypothetical protein
MVGTVVELSEVKDELRFRELIAGLASRHIKYGVKSHHASIMGQVTVDRHTWFYYTLFKAKERHLVTF